MPDEKEAPPIPDDEQAMWDETGVGQPPSRDPATAITVSLCILGGAILAALVLSAVFS